jgi:hypothetical protein
MKRWLCVLWWHIRAMGAKDITKDLETAIAEETSLVLKPGKYRIKS